MEKENAVIDGSFSLAIRIVNLYKYHTVDKKEFVLSKQLLRSGTSVGANVRESKHAESTADFLHKLGIAQKECAETQYWLELLHATDYLSDTAFNSIYYDCTVLQKIITKIITTTKRNKLQ